MKYTCPKVNIEAVQEIALRIDKRFMAEQRHNGLYIRHNLNQIRTDELLSLSLMLYGVHNAFTVACFAGEMYLYAGVYEIQPEFIVDGEEVEFELFDKNSKTE